MEVTKSKKLSDRVVLIIVPGMLWFAALQEERQAVKMV